MIYLVDNTIDGKGVSPREILSALERVRPDLEVLVEPFHKVSLQRIEELSPSHIVLSGQSHPWEMYTSESLAGLYDVIRSAPRPVLGVCGGHQQMALAFGAPVGLMERLSPGEGYEGAKRVRGFIPIQTPIQTPVERAANVLFQDLPRTITVWHSHCDEVKELPAGFHLTAFSETCAIQAMQHDSMPLFGVQFHPELFDETYPAGQKVLENFLET